MNPDSVKRELYFLAQKRILYKYMRTTVDIPDGVYRRIKAKAAMKGMTFRGYLVGALQRDLERPIDAPKKRLKGPLFSKQKPLVTTEEALSEILEEEDRALLG